MSAQNPDFCQFSFFKLKFDLSLNIKFVFLIVNKYINIFLSNWHCHIIGFHVYNLSSVLPHAPHLYVHRKMSLIWPEILKLHLRVTNCGFPSLVEDHCKWLKWV